LLSQIRLSSVTFVRPTQVIATFRSISLPFCTLTIVQMVKVLTFVQIFTQILPGNPSVGGVKHKRGIATYVTFRVWLPV